MLGSVVWKSLTEGLYKVNIVVLQKKKKKTEPTVESSGNGTKFVKVVLYMTGLFDEREKKPGEVGLRLVL